MREVCLLAGQPAAHGDQHEDDRNCCRLFLYGERRDAMLEALHNYFPPEVTWTHPSGGLFLWVTLPPGIDTMKLLDTALQQDVAFVPGDPFFPGGDRGSHMRLNFSNARPVRIQEGIRRLSIAVAHELEHQAAGVTV